MVEPVRKQPLAMQYLRKLLRTDVYYKREIWAKFYCVTSLHMYANTNSEVSWYRKINVSFCIIMNLMKVVQLTNYQSSFAELFTVLHICSIGVLYVCITHTNTSTSRKVTSIFTFTQEPYLFWHQLQVCSKYAMPEGIKFEVQKNVFVYTRYHWYAY